MTKLYDAGYDKVMMVVGSDRVKDFDKLLNKYNGKKATHGFYEFPHDVEIVSAGERDPDAQGVEGMSASKMRKSAVDGDLDSFKSGVPNMSDSDKENLYNDVRKWMNVKEQVQERTLSSNEKKKLEKQKKEPEEAEPAVEEQALSRVDIKLAYDPALQQTQLKFSIPLH